MAKIATALLALLALVGANDAAPADAAPALAISLNHSPASIARTDNFLTYTATVRNTAVSGAPAGAQVLCNGVPPGTSWGSSPSQFAYAWLRNGVVIPGETSSTYTITGTDAGKAIQCTVTGTNTTSNASYITASRPALVADPPPTVAPAVSNPNGNPQPTVTGTASAAGNVLTCTAPVNGWSTIATGSTTSGSNSLTAVTTTTGTGNTTAGSSTVANVKANGGVPFQVGQTITGTVGFPAGTTITAVTSTTLTLSVAATTNRTNNALTAGPQPFAVGQAISGAGIPVGTTITAISGQTLTLSNNATATAAKVSLSGPATNNAAWSFAWWRNGAPASGTATQTSPSTGTYTLTSSDVATAGEFECEAFATNGGGSVAVFSPPAQTTAPAPTLAVGTAPNQATGATTTLGQQTDGTAVTATVTLPGGVRLAGSPSGTGWTCTPQQPQGASPAMLTCTRSDVLSAQTSWPDIGFSAAIVGDVGDPLVTVAAVSGGGSSPASGQDSMNFSGAGPIFGITDGSFFTQVLDLLGHDETRAGAHPVSAEAGFQLNLRTTSDGTSEGVEGVRTIKTDLPAGFVGNPTAARSCASSLTLIDTWSFRECPDASIVGRVTLRAGSVANGSPFVDFPVYLLTPSNGHVAQLGFSLGTIGATYVLNAQLRPDTNTVQVVSAPVVHRPALSQVDLTLCSYGVSIVQNTNVFAGHQINQADIGATGCKAPTDAGAFATPFLSNPTQCSGENPVTHLSADSWEHPGTFVSADALAPKVTACDQVAFSPSVSIAPSSLEPDSASGLVADIGVPTDGLLSPSGIRQSDLKKAVVTLPAGMSVNPSGAAGLASCSDAQLALGTDDPTTCPDASKVGTVDITSPLIAEHLTGEVVLRTPTSTDPTSGGMLRLAIIARNDARGILVKLPGSATADPQTGQLVATFDQNPQLPFSDLKVTFKGGDRGVLAMPQPCGEITANATLTPWSGGADAQSATPTTVTGDCSFGFAPKVDAGSSNNTARNQGGTYSFTFSRRDGEQWVNGLVAKLPTGLLASVAGVPLCSDADAAAGVCSEGSKIGTVDGTAGSGTPFVLERKGSAFLTEGYKGCAYGLDVTVPVVAGPFDASSPETDLGSINVRQSVCVDPTDAHVTVTSDPLPTIWHGIPLRVRSITVAIDRKAFMVNPSDCSAKDTGAGFLSPEGGAAFASSPFQVTGCDKLAFAPKIAIGLGDPTQVKDGGHPDVDALVTQAPGEAGIKKAQVTLPLQLALDPNNANGLCEYTDGLKADCPPNSVIGQATAVSPLLNKPISGPVYFVKGVRFNAKGQPIRTLPTLLVKLHGEIDVNLRATSSVDSKNRLVNTFDNVPDAPISGFLLHIDGGQHGILVVTRNQNICKQLDRGLAAIDAQSNAQHDFLVSMSTPCDAVNTPMSIQLVHRHAVVIKVHLARPGLLKVIDLNQHLKPATRRVTKAGTYTVALTPNTEGRMGLAAGRPLHSVLGFHFTPDGSNIETPFALRDVTLKP